MIDDDSDSDTDAFNESRDGCLSVTPRVKIIKIIDIYFLWDNDSINTGRLYPEKEYEWTPVLEVLEILIILPPNTDNITAGVI